MSALQGDDHFRFFGADREEMRLQPFAPPEVYGVFPGAVDTDMLAGVEMPKTHPAEIARAVMAGIESGAEDIFPDGMSTQLYAAWKADHKAVEKQFAAM